ncbi:OapC/ArvC family zinc-ribbon domain-containing protein [Halorientalis pallida]|uniref:OapC/ArvC family zinc-ribbon domain-containing protein n=1 Tax=Halorientalis pallida TaxID=2479928 RepID=UPI003C70153A
MPHQCTSCGQVFDDGSKEMLSGCPDCGGNKFQFHASTEDVPEEPEPSAEPPDPPTPDSSVARTVGNAAATVRDLVGSSGSQSAGTPDDEPSGRDPAPADSIPSEPAPAPDRTPTDTPASREDAAQADARSEVVSPDEIPAGSDPPTGTETPVHDDTSATGNAEPDTPDRSDASDPTGDAGARVAEEPSEDRPDLSELREELNDQFESIKVLSPGQYELNLMELYDREEYIIALQEDGRYTIQVPENWHD